MNRPMYFSVLLIALVVACATNLAAEARLSNHFIPMADEAPAESEEGEPMPVPKKNTFMLGGYLGLSLVDYEVEDETQDGDTIDAEGEYEYDATTLGLQASGSFNQKGALTRIGVEGFLGFGTSTITIKDPGFSDIELDGTAFEIGTTVWMHFGTKNGSNEFGGLVGLGLHVVASTYDRDERFAFNEASFADVAFPILLGGYGLFPAGDGHIALQGGLEIGLSAANFNLSDSRGVEEDIDYGSSRDSIAALFIGGAFNINQASIGASLTVGGTTAFRIHAGFVFG